MKGKAEDREEDLLADSLCRSPQMPGPDQTSQEPGVSLVHPSQAAGLSIWSFSATFQTLEQGAAPEVSNQDMVNHPHGMLVSAKPAVPEHQSSMKTALVEKC